MKTALSQIVGLLPEKVNIHQLSSELSSLLNNYVGFNEAIDFISYRQVSVEIDKNNLWEIIARIVAKHTTNTSLAHQVTEAIINAPNLFRIVCVKE